MADNDAPEKVAAAQAAAPNASTNGQHATATYAARLRRRTIHRTVVWFALLSIAASFFCGQSNAASAVVAALLIAAIVSQGWLIVDLVRQEASRGL